MKEAEIDNLLDLLDTFAAEHGGGREQACFHAATAIREMRDALEPLWQRARTPGADRVPDDGTVTVFMRDCREAAKAAGR